MSALTRPPVSAIVCTRDRPELLPIALAALAMALREGDELIVVESGDSQAKQALADLDTKATTVHVPSDRREKSYKLNLGIARASAEILLLTDDDVQVAPAWADAMAVPFADPSVGVAFGSVRGLTRHADDEPPSGDVGEAPFETWTYAHGASMAVRKRAVSHIGGFDERLGPGAPAHGEEHDVVLRMREEGWRVMITAAPPVAHVAWRTDPESQRNLLVYERGGGAVVGAALRRDPRRWGRMAVRRVRYQLVLLRDSPLGWATARAFVGGLVYGLRLSPRRHD